MGKKLLLPLIGRHYAVCRYADVKKNMHGLDLQVVGGLVNRGSTTNDVDVIGSRADIPILAHRLQSDGIEEPIHYCGGKDEKHSHLKCAYYGIKMVLTGKGY